jgi:predicted HTH domain antitoxin
MAAGVSGMARVSLDIPDELLAVLTEHTRGNELSRELKKHLAVALYAQSIITLGSAAALAGMSYYDFWQYLARFGLGPRYTEQHLEEDLKTLRELGLLEGDS